MKLTSPLIRNLSISGTILALSIGLAACSTDSLKDSLGYGKQAPDEFAIVTKAPLVFPPDFSLRPPQPGVARPQEANFEPNIVAQNALTGGALVSDEAAGTAGEVALLEKTGGAQANPQIRQVVNNDTRALVEKDQSFTDEILFWQKGADNSDARTVDAGAERRRIEQNEAQGKPVTTGETPTVAPEKEGFFSGLWSSIF
ncbi:MAG: DUF3035 domain-containing protein [Pseudomonadota bacterium]